MAGSIEKILTVCGKAKILSDNLRQSLRMKG
jgi:hypothetical protein